MQLTAIVHQDRVCIDESAESKTAALLKVSQLLCQNQTDLDVQNIFDSFWRRDSLGSTSIGHGIIIPHIRSASIQDTLACFLKLEHPIDFGAEDKQPIDLVFGLIAPEDNPEQHLEVLKHIAKLFNQPEARQACRNANDSSELYRALTNEAYGHVTPKPLEPVEA
jgi:nitrogen PTS system EIIA component